MFKKIAFFSLLFFAANNLHGAADPTDVMQCSVVIKSSYHCTLRDFINTHLKGSDSVSIKLTTGPIMTLYNVNGDALLYILEYVNVMLLKKVLASHPDFQANYQGLMVNAPSRTELSAGQAWHAFQQLVKTTRPTRHGHLSQEIITDNFHKMFLYMFDQKVPTAEQVLQAVEKAEQYDRTVRCCRCLFLSGLTALGVCGYFHDHQE
ncbi:hypothetical protein K2X40_04795 [Candidatus Babeliales bacterium]|nr:hypothetical protein [Candidatus Babeliales bacterium]